MILFFCPNCETKLSAETKEVGQRRFCPHCQAIMEVPGSSDPIAVEHFWTHPRKALTPPPEPLDSRAVGGAFFFLSITLAVGGYFTWTNWQVTRLCGNEPTTMTLAELTQGEYPANRWVKVTNALLLTDGLAITDDDDNGEVWHDSWLPVADLDDAARKPGRRVRARMVIHFDRFMTGKKLWAHAEQTEFTGLVLSRVTSLKPALREIMERTYPELANRELLVFEADAAPYAALHLLLAFIATLVLSLFFTYLLVIALWPGLNPFVQR